LSGAARGSLRVTPNSVRCAEARRSGRSAGSQRDDRLGVGKGGSESSLRGFVMRRRGSAIFSPPYVGGAGGVSGLESRTICAHRHAGRNATPPNPPFVRGGNARDQPRREKELLPSSPRSAWGCAFWTLSVPLDRRNLGKGPTTRSVGQSIRTPSVGTRNPPFVRGGKGAQATGWEMWAPRRRAFPHGVNSPSRAHRSKNF
jgi:hypothetical protein